MKRLLFFGDSITDCGRDYQARIGTDEQLGEGFVRQINANFFIESEERVQIINKGINGNTTIDLLERIDSDVLKLKPDTVVLMIGINDVWRNFDAIFEDIVFICPERFKDNYLKILEIMMEKNIQLLVVSAYLLNNDIENPMREMLDSFNKIIETICNRYSIPFLNIQEKFDSFLENNSSYMLSSDQIHMNYLGNQMLAKYIYNFIIESEK